jgi:hypothetical protein
LLEECSLPGYYAVWLLQEPHCVISRKTPLLIVSAVKTSNLTFSVLFVALFFFFFFFFLMLRRDEKFFPVLRP